MNIIFDDQNLDQIKDTNILLELDTFYIASLDKTVTAYCVVDNVKLTDFDKVPQIQNLHAQLLTAYKNKDFKLCQDLIEVLLGSFDGELDSFYQSLESRIDEAKQSNDQSWTGVILR